MFEFDDVSLSYADDHVKADATRPVMHRRHFVDETFIRASLQLAMRHGPEIHVGYMGSTHLGESAVCASGWIARLASLDLQRFRPAEVLVVIEP